MFAIGNILQGLAYVLDTVLFLYMWLIIIRVSDLWKVLLRKTLT